MTSVAQTTSTPSQSAPTQLDPAVEAAAFKRLYPRKYLSRFLEHDRRPDGRPTDSWREVGVNAGAVSTANGSALIRLGDTTVVCGIKAETAEPDWDRPNEGWLVPNVDLPAISSPNFKPGPPVDEAQVFSQQIYDLLISSNVLPLRKLGIRPGKSAWVLYIDIVCINYDGNAFDAAVLAVMTALRNTVLPVATYDEDADQTICSRTETRNLKDDLRSIPLACTFGIFDNKYLLPDPSAFELPLCPTTITIAIDSTDPTSSSKSKSKSTKAAEPRIRLVRQEGMGGYAGKAGIEVVGECIGAAKARVRELSEKLYGQ
ncbi:hypothetical protein FFLO_04013 [Filobasidium floriforme]|uniref:Ribosomal RNA-processing protein 43 n=1 Tax=Filobasidium floriforme TaxID=5210 RepID=A0A8K0JL23_9TREE|nr:hypothetical protein FFLO_04013 [Filobasidium floriforme]